MRPPRLRRDRARPRPGRKVVRNALEAGWEWVRYTKAGHIEIRWPATDARLFTGTTPSDRNAWKAFARQIEKASGIDARVKAGRR